MERENILKLLGVKGADIDCIADRLIEDSVQIPQLVEALKIEKRSRKYSYEKTLRRISEKRPDLIYPYFEFFAELLDSENSFLKWGAIMTLANLAAADTQNKFETIFKKYFAPVRGPELVTAVNVIGGGAKIARSRPELADPIAREILKVEKADFLHKGELSPECRNVAAARAVDAFDQFFDRVGCRDRVMRFVRRQLGSTRSQAVKKAERFLRNHEN